MTSLDRAELARYSRQVILPQVGTAGQQRLKDARVLLVGAGGLGSPAALYLAAAGVGTIGIVDDDRVDASNLQRQVLHATADVGMLKVDSARARLAALNPHVEMETHAERFDVDNARRLVASYDMVLDGTDNFATRYLVNDACVLERRPNVYASVSRFDGQASIFAHADGPCYRCLFPAPPPAGLIPSCADAGVLGVLPGLLGTIQATEALKLILGIGEPLIGRLLTVDALEMRMRTIAIQRDPDCPSCGVRADGRLSSIEWSCETPLAEIESVALRTRLERGDDLVLIDVREPGEWALDRIEGARLVPLGTLSTLFGELDRGVAIVVHCQSGARSAIAARQLLDAGFTTVANLRGGIARYRAEFPVESTV